MLRNGLCRSVIVFAIIETDLGIPIWLLYVEAGRFIELVGITEDDHNRLSNIIIVWVSAFYSS